MIVMFPTLFLAVLCLPFAFGLSLVGRCYRKHSGFLRHGVLTQERLLGAEVPALW